MTVSYIIAGLFALMSIPLFLGKATFFIAGYNTMLPKEKEKFNKEHDVKKMCRATGVLLLVIAVLTAIIGYYNSQTVALYCMITIITIVLFFTTYINVGCKKN